MTECRDEYGGQQNCSKHIFTKNPATPCKVYDCSNSSFHSLSGSSYNAFMILITFSSSIRANQLWQCSRHYLFFRLRSVVAGIGTPTLKHATRSFSPTAPLKTLTNWRMIFLCASIYTSSIYIYMENYIHVPWAISILPSVYKKLEQF